MENRFKLLESMGQPSIMAKVQQDILAGVIKPTATAQFQMDFLAGKIKPDMSVIAKAMVSKDLGLVAGNLTELAAWAAGNDVAKYGSVLSAQQVNNFKALGAGLSKIDTSGWAAALGDRAAISRFVESTTMASIITVPRAWAFVPSPRRQRSTQPDGDIEGLLSRIWPELLNKWSGARGVPGRTRDSIGQAAYSAAMLVRGVLDYLASERDVWEYMEETGAWQHGVKRRGKPDWLYRIMYMAWQHGLDESALSAALGQPVLLDRLEDIKHRPHRYTQGDVMMELDAVEALLRFLAQRLR